MKRLGIFLYSFFLGYSYSYGYESVNLEEREDLRNRFAIHDYKSLELLSFSDTKKIGWGGFEAWTYLRNEDENEWYRIVPQWFGDKKSVLFMTPESCAEDTKISLDQVIYINRTAVTAVRLCAPDSHKSFVAGYYVQNEAGRKFLIDEFNADPHIVEVKFSRRSIPFHTEGFREALDSLGAEKPL